VQPQAALGGHRARLSGDDLDPVAVGARQAPVGAGEDLMGADRVERLEAGEGDDDHAVHPQRVTRPADGVNAAVPTFPAIERIDPAD